MRLAVVEKRLKQIKEEAEKAIYASTQTLRERAEAPGDLMDEALNHSVCALAGEAARLQTYLRNQADEALQRLARGRYGKCEDCGDEISDARLEAVPCASRCLECQEAYVAVAPV